MRFLHRHVSDAGAFTGHASRRYNTWAAGPLRWVYRSLARDVQAAAPRGVTVLDVGTGPGVLLTELARLRPDLELIGIDISADMVAAARRNLAPYAPRANVHTGDVARLPLADRCVDLVVSTLSSHHWAEPAAAVPEMARVLRPGGRAYIYDLRSGPFDTLVASARDRSLFTGATPQRTLVRIGALPWPRLTRLALTI